MRCAQLSRKTIPLMLAACLLGGRRVPVHAARLGSHRASPPSRGASTATSWRRCSNARRALPEAEATRLTPAGHEFADTVEDMQKRPAATGSSCQPPPRSVRPPKRRSQAP